MPDAEFEKTFADLAHARMRDRAPGLLDHLVGFQLLDKNDENTRAVGVWGFKVGEEWLYAPVFFLNGQLKGDELLYLKSQDTFVPLKENWINYLLNRKPYVLGESEMKQPGELGIRQPDFNVLARPPYTGSKYASAGTLRSLVDYLSANVGDDFKSFLPVVMSPPGGEKRASLTRSFDIPSFIRRAGVGAAETLLGTIKKNASFADSLMKFYRMEDIIDAAKEAFENAVKDGDLTKAAADGDKKIEGTAPSVRVITADNANVDDVFQATLSDDEKERLQRDRYIVRDNRGDGEVGGVYNRQISKTLQNPSDTCYTPVLMANGEYMDHLIVIAPKGGRERSGGRMNDDIMLVDLDNGNRLRLARTKGVFVNNDGHKVQDWDRHFKALPAASSAREKDKAIFVNEKGEATLPLFIKRKIITEDGQVQLYGDWDRFPWTNEDNDLSAILYPRYQGRHFNESDAKGEHSYYGNVRSIGDCDDESIVLTRKDGNNVTKIGETLFVPNGFKLIRVNTDDIDPWKLRDYEHESTGKPFDEIPEKPRKPRADELASPQTLADIEMQLFKSGMCEKVQTVTDGIEWWLRFNSRQSGPMSKLAAMKELIIRHDLREKDAVALLKLATRQGSPEYIIKRAQPTAPAFPEPPCW